MLPPTPLARAVLLFEPLQVRLGRFVSSLVSSLEALARLGPEQPLSVFPYFARDVFHAAAAHLLVAPAMHASASACRILAGDKIYTRR
jgi:hypothetical protein